MPRTNDASNGAILQAAPAAEQAAARRGWWKFGGATLAAGTAGLAAASSISLADEAEHGLHAPQYPWPHEGFFRCWLLAPHVAARLAFVPTTAAATAAAAAAAACCCVEGFLGSAADLFVATEPLLLPPLPPWPPLNCSSLLFLPCSSYDHRSIRRGFQVYQQVGASCSRVL